MKICLIAEGSYPYITGGVSSWMQTIITNMPEEEFVIYTIGAEEKNRGKFKYNLPRNVIHVEEVFLDSYSNESVEWGKRYLFKPEHKTALIDLLTGKKVDWTNFFALMQELHAEKISDFLTSKDLFDIIQQVCEEKYTEVPFIELYWTLRSMIMPMLTVLQQPPPAADIYHSVTTGYAGIAGSMAKHLYQKPLILTEHGIYTREREEEIIKANWIQGYMKNLWIEYFYQLSDCVYTSSDKVLTLFTRNKELQIELGCPEELIEIVPNGVATEVFLELISSPRVDNSVCIGALVRVVPIKDIKTMLQSFAYVKRHVQQGKFFVFGPTDEDEEYYEECLQLVESLGLQDCVFTGSVNILDYLGDMDILVLTSVSEGQPLAVLEGMAAGKPHVSTDVGSCKELLYGVNDEFGQAGIVVPVMHYTKIGEALVTLCKNKELRQEMGRNGQKRVAALYQKNKMIEKYRAMYSKHGGITQWQESASN
jgi:glycosyltransferase involved in cell wall biosynthesis